MIGGQGVAGAHRVTGTLGLEAVWVSVIVGSGSWCVYPVVNKLLLPPRDTERRRRLLVALLRVSQNCRDVIHVRSCKQSESKSKISVSGENLTIRPIRPRFFLSPLYQVTPMKSNLFSTAERCQYTTPTTRHHLCASAGALLNKKLSIPVDIYYKSCTETKNAINLLLINLLSIKPTKFLTLLHE